MIYDGSSKIAPPHKRARQSSTDGDSKLITRNRILQVL